MKNSYTDLLDAVAANPSLQRDLIGAGTPEHKQAIIQAAGASVPTLEDFETFQAAYNAADPNVAQYAPETLGAAWSSVGAYGAS